MKAFLLFISIMLGASDSISFSWFVATKIIAVVILVYLILKVEKI